MKPITFDLIVPQRLLPDGHQRAAIASVRLVANGQNIQRRWSATDNPVIGKAENKQYKGTSSSQGNRGNHWQRPFFRLTYAYLERFPCITPEGDFL